jgi:lipoate-protein ligase A
MSELLVLPDIHGRVFWKRPCEDIDSFKRVVFLGDYTDPYSFEEITPADAERIRQDYVTARRAWIAEIRKDAEKEYSMGDVEQEVFDDFLEKLDHEIDYEN